MTSGALYNQQPPIRLPLGHIADGACAIVTRNNHRNGRTPFYRVFSPHFERLTRILSVNYIWRCGANF